MDTSSLNRSDYVEEIPLMVGEWRFHPLDDPEKYEDSGKACGYAYHRNDPSNRRFMKIQRNAGLCNLSLIGERENYKLVQGRVYNLSKIIDYGEEGPWTFLVLEDLGFDLGKANKMWGPRKFCLIYGMVAGMLSRLAEIHRAGYIHTDVKPGNFISRRSNARVSVVDLETLHCCPTPPGTLRGTPFWASLHSLRREALSFRDDLHSLAYCLIYFVRGSLPWTDEDAQDVEYLASIKAEMSTYEHYQDLPLPCAQFVTYCLSLEFSSEPDYTYLNSCMASMGGVYQYM